MSDRNDAMNEQLENRLALPGVLEKTGDEEHDALTDQVHGLDALSPLRNSVVREANQEAYDEALEDLENGAFDNEEEDTNG
jgi:hypothetical protein